MYRYEEDDPNQCGVLGMLCVDPSLTCTGWALFEHNYLVDCGYVAGSKGSLPDRIRHAAGLGEKDVGLPLGVSKLVIEVPQIYQRAQGKTKGNPNDVAKLWGIAGAYLVNYDSAKAELVKPFDWKGNAPKTVTFARILKRLSAAELKTFNRKAFPRARGRGDTSTEPPSETQHAGDVLDAVGIGLWKLDRLHGRNR